MRYMRANRICAQVREESVGIKTILARKSNLRASTNEK